MGGSAVPRPREAPAPSRPIVRLFGRDVPVVLPARRDPRLKLAAVIVSLQVLGQTVLEFKLSIAQILVSIGVCAVIEIGVTLVRHGILIWPGSAMLTGNSVAFILRTSGTQHGEWWSLNGIHFFVLAAVLSMVSKYVIRVGDRHVFNPSNAGLVWTFLLVGPAHVFPQYLWWGPIGVPVVLALAVILAGAVWILKDVGMARMAAAFLAPFAALIGVLAAAGNSFYAVWSPNPVGGLSYWANIVLSPEVLVFVFFMMSDPQTAARTPRGRILYGAATAALAALLISFQPTEFGIKLAILSSLTVTAALSPLFDAAARRRAAGAGDVLPLRRDSRSWSQGLRNRAVVAAAIVALAAPVNTTLLADNEEIILIERGLLGPASPQ